MVTDIVYGGSFVGSLTQSNSALDEKERLHAEAQIKVIQSLGAFGSASGEGKIDFDEEKKLYDYSLELRMVADYVGLEVPVTAPALSEKIPKAPSLLGIPVPIKIQLLPTSGLLRMSTELLYQEISQNALKELSKLLRRFDHAQQKSQCSS